MNRPSNDTSAGQVNPGAYGNWNPAAAQQTAANAQSVAQMYNPPAAAQTYASPGVKPNVQPPNAANVQAQSPYGSPMPNQFRYYVPFRGPFDPCPPIAVKWYNVPPNLFLGFQPPNLPQFPPQTALRAGTLWPALYGPYPPKSG